MLTELIEKTNTKKFYNDCDFYLESKSLITSEKKLELIVSINQNSYDIPIEYEEWKVTCNGYIKSDNLDNKFFMPYVKMEIFDKHPVLWNFLDEKFECYIKGIPNNIKEFYGELSIELDKHTGNWIKLTDLFWNLDNIFKQSQKKYKEIPESLLSVIKKVCEDFDLKFEIEKQIHRQESALHNESAKLLIFGNEDVSPNTFYLQQPYIIATSFEAHRVK
tara:strand:- start:97 stop:753 length:657 start_codon:yes stop_codon:yes gene_type:complete